MRSGGRARCRRAAVGLLLLALVVVAIGTRWPTGAENLHGSGIDVHCGAPLDDLRSSDTVRPGRSDPFIPFEPGGDTGTSATGYCNEQALERFWLLAATTTVLVIGAVALLIGAAAAHRRANRTPDPAPESVLART